MAGLSASERAMPSFADMIQQGTGYAWLFVPTAILLGALHGLEPGHSKTMMAAFIVAIRGTVKQAVLLGLAATVSHTAVVWAVALGGMYLAQGLDAETSEPWFQLAAAVMIVALAAWMIVRAWQDQRAARAAEAGHGHDHPHPHGHGHGHAYPHDHGHGHRHRHDHPHPHEHGHNHGHGHGHDHDHDHAHAHRHDHPHPHKHDHGHGHAHAHGEETRRVDTGHGVVVLEIFEDGVPPRWRLRTESGAAWTAPDVAVETLRPDGTRQRFAFAARDGFLESLDTIPEPHAFEATLELSHGDHAHTYPLRFAEHAAPAGVTLPAGTGYQDAHEREHGEQIIRRFEGRPVTTWQIILFGLTGGLIPCPAAITVLLICLQLQEIPLGVVMVLAFSIGLAVTLVAIGVVASLGMRHAASRWPGFDTWLRRAPYASGALMILVGLYVGAHALGRIAA
jgi:nickel/cobalt exporter